MPNIFGGTVIIGEITVSIYAHSNNGTEKVEFYIDDELKFTDYDMPYDWHWDEKAFGTHELKVIAYDNEGNEVEDEINVTIFNLGW